MGIFDRRRAAEQRAERENAPATVLALPAWMLTGEITREQALNIQAVAAGVKLIADAVAGLPVKLYEERDGKTEPVEDPREELLNGETGDAMTGEQMKRALVMDYLLDGAGYAYIEKQRGRIRAIKYVPRDKVDVTTSEDPLNKNAIIYINGREREPHRVLRLLNGTVDGYTGLGLIQRCNEALETSYKQMTVELNLAKAGGGQRGFLQANRPLTEEKLTKLRESWKKYAEDAENTTVMVLNEGITFKEANSTLVEMQLSELKEQNADLISATLGVPLEMLTGKPTDEMYRSFVKTAVMPVLRDFEAALDHVLLLESERGKRYFAFDTRELTRGDMVTRYGAYKTALEAGFLQPDEVRNLENLEPLGLDFVRLGLQDVYYYPDTKIIYTPNTGVSAKIGEGGAASTLEAQQPARTTPQEGEASFAATVRAPAASEIGLEDD